MPRKVSEAAERKKSLYIPKPTEWTWDTISDYTVRDRLAAARQTRERLEGWSDDLRRQRREAQRELWERLPMAKLYEQQTKLARLEDMGKQLTQLGKLLGQVTAAIEYIEERTGMRVAT